jgi:O-antigen/teichoic acid export membrane protein
MMQRFRPFSRLEALLKRSGAGSDFRKILANMGWLTFEHVIRLGVGFFIVALIARHLGTHDFGILSYAMSLTALLGAFVYLGLSGIVVRNITERPEDSSLLMGSVFALKLLGAVLGVGILALIATVSGVTASEGRVLLVIGASLLVKPMDTIDIWFQSKTSSKYAVWARSAAFFIASSGRIVLLWKAAPLSAFAVLVLVEFLLAGIFLLTVYAYTGETVRSWKVRISSMRGLLSESWILLLSSFLALVYLKLDQLMLRWMIGADEVGIYAVAAKISEVWYFIPTAIGASLLPKLTQMRAKDEVGYNAKLQQGFDILFALSFSIAIGMSFASAPLIANIFGTEYAAAGSILAIHIWAGVFIFMRALFSKWIIVENLLGFSLLSHGVGALVNVALNLLLIPPYGGQGAAVATLVSYAVASYLILFLAPQTRPVAYMMSRSIAFPIRLAKLKRNAVSM